jgi:homoserine dehydrogenase
MSGLTIAERSDAGSQTRTIRVALAGCGVVGGHLAALLREHGAAIERSRGIRVELVRVLVRDVQRPRLTPLAPHILTADAESFLATPADVVIEALGGHDPAERIAWSTLAAGRDYITANKLVVARRGEELRDLARHSRARFSFEAAVAGGVPVLRVLRDALVGDDVRAVRGVLNGTTNYILSHLHEGATFSTALADAQASGFAEADPSRDLDGRDAADKIAILAWIAFGTDPARLRVHRSGLLPDPEALISAARTFGGVARLIAECVRLPGAAIASVEPVLVRPGSRFAAVHGADNLVEIDSAWSGALRFSGAGAGGAPTATALLGDILASPSPLSATHSRACSDAHDPRPRRWVLSVRCTDRRSLIDACTAAGLTGVGVHADRRTGTLHVLTERCLRADVARATALLRARHEAVIASRYDLEDDS